MRRRRRDDHYDSRVTQTAVELFSLGKRIVAAGAASDSDEIRKIEIDLHRELHLRPWQISPLDFELFDMSTQTPTADFLLVRELHALLAEAAS
jgi:hypothetical protein